MISRTEVNWNPARINSSRDYRPHMTIARVKPPARVDLPKIRADAMQTIHFHVDRVRIMRSVLAPAGAHHKEFHEVMLAQDTSRHA